MFSRYCVAAPLAALVAFAASAGAQPQTAEDFFKGKTLRFAVVYEPGGSYDLYARLISTHMPRHLPGNPPMVVQYVPGAGGLVGILHTYEKAAQDGTEIAILPRDLAINQMLRPDTAKYDARRFNWIGTLSSYAGVMFVAPHRRQDGGRSSAYPGGGGIMGADHRDLHHADPAQCAGRNEIQDRDRVSRRAGRRSRC